MTDDLPIAAVLELVNATRWSEVADILETRKGDLWGAPADKVFTGLLRQNANDQEALGQINRRWDILKAARAKGIPAAHEVAQGIGTRRIIDAATLQRVHKALQSGDQAALDDVLDLHPELIPILKQLMKPG